MVKKKNLRRGAKSARLGAIPDTLHTIAAPFDAYDAKWPDDATALSGTAVTRAYIRTTFTPLDGGTSTSHAGGILMLPHPTISYCKLNSRASPYDTAAGSGLTDLSNTAGTGTTNWIPATNLSGLVGGSTSTDFARIRCVGMGLRAQYLGTELNRAGRMVAGNMLIAQQPTTFATTGTKYSAISSMGNGNADQFCTDLRQAMVSAVEARDPDGVLEAHWIPNGVPSYQLVGGQLAYTDTLFTTSAGAGRPGTEVITYFNCPDGKFGVQSGQNALLWFFEGDTTSSAVAASNAFSIELIWHWEIIPNEPFSVVYPLNPSPYIPQELAMVINYMQVEPVGFVARQATDYSVQTDPQQVSNHRPSFLDYARGAMEFIGNNPTLTNVARLVANAATGNYAGALSSAYTAVIGSRRAITMPKRKSIAY